MAAWTGWEVEVLAALKAPNTVDNRKFLDDWHSYEQSACRNNPLNTTQRWPGANNCNSVGVKNYRTQFDGTQATVTTLKNGRYPDIVAALKSGDPYSYPGYVQVAAQIDTWGTHSFSLAYTLATAPSQPASTTPAPSGLSVSAQHSLSGWHKLSLTLGGTLPRSLAQSSRARRAALRALR